MNALVTMPLEGELLPPGEVLLVRAALHPFRVEHQDIAVPLGSSIEEIVALCFAARGGARRVWRAEVTFDGEPVPRERWARIRVRSARARILVRAVPGKSFGNIFKTLLSFALLILVSVVFGPAGFVAGLVGQTAAGVLGGLALLGGNMLLNSLFPPSQMKADTPKTVYSIASRQNSASKWQPIPALLGHLRFAPKFASAPYTEFAGDDQYLRQLFVWFLGEGKVTDLKLGETPITEYDDVEIITRLWRPGDKLQLYPSEVVQQDLNIELTKDIGKQTRLSADEAVEVQLDFVCPQGIYQVNKETGKKRNHSVELDVVLRAYPSGIIAATRKITFRDNDADPIRRTERFAGLAEGQYWADVTRLTGDDDEKADTVQWTALRTMRTSEPIEFEGELTITELRIRATKQLNGVIQDLTGLGSSLERAWDGSQWQPASETRNPADHFRHVLQGPGIAISRTDEQMDLVSIEAWADSCRNRGLTFDMYRDFRASVRDTLRDICAAGRAVPTLRDGKWSVAMEDDASPIVQHFTPRNSRDFRWEKTFRQKPHALRCKFVNALKEWIEDELIVYAPGFSKATAKLFETAEFPGVTHPDLIYKHAHYRFAEADLRDSVYRMTVDFEHLIATRGDRVYVSHDVLDNASVRSQGRIVEVAGNLLTVDEPLIMRANTAYVMRIRSATGGSRLLTLAQQPLTATLDTVAFTGEAPQEGDLFAFGPPGEEAGVFKVLAINRSDSDDLSAEIELVDEAPGIQGADMGPVPDTGGNVVVPPPLALYRPTDLQIAQTIEERGGALAQVTRLLWRVREGGPELAIMIVVAVSSEGKEERLNLAGEVRVAEFVNLESADWTFRVQGFTADGRGTGYSNALTLDQVLPEEDLGITHDQLSTALREQVDLLINDAEGSLADIRAKLLQNIGDVAASATTAVSAEAKARQDADGALSTRITTAQAKADGAASAVSTEQTARANADTALGRRIDSVVAVAGDTAAALENEMEARASADGALAKQIQSALAQTNLATASGYYKLEAIANGPGGRSRFEVFLNAGTPASPKWASTGFIMEAWIENGLPKSRTIHITDTFVIASSRNGETVIPFFVENGVVYIQKATIKDLTAANFAPSAVSVTGGAIVETSRSLSRGNTNLVSVALKTSPGRVSINFGIDFRLNSYEGSFTFPMRILRSDIGTIRTRNVQIYNPGRYQSDGSEARTIVSSQSLYATDFYPVDAEVTYTFQVSTPSDFQSVTALSSYIYCENFKV